MRRGKNGSTIRAGAWLPLVSLVLGGAACGARSDLLEPSEGAIGKGNEDAAADGESDAGVDARPDARSDGGPDAHVSPEPGADAGQDAPDHPFLVKFRLFEGGRWPLGIVAGRFRLF